MPIETKFDLEKKLLLRKVKGNISPLELNEAIFGLVEHPGYQRGMSSIWDFREGSLRELTESNVRAIRNEINDDEFAEKRGEGFRVAIVTTNAVDRGLANMQLMPVALNFEYKFFEDYAKAYDWVTEDY